MFVDSDVELSDNCVALLLSDLEKYNWVGVQAKMISTGNSSYWEICQNEAYTRVYGAPGPRDQIDTISSMFRRDILLKIGFDPYFKESAEDVDLCMRLRAHSLELGVSGAVAYHHHRVSFAAFARQRFRNGVGVARLSSKYRRRTILDPLIAAASQTVRSLNPSHWKMVPFWMANGALYFIGALYGLGRIARSSHLSTNLKHAFSEE
jgi:GT2 family glycosyltransferase